MWKAHFFGKPETCDNPRKMAYGFDTRKCEPQHSDLSNFESDLLSMIKNITFKRVKKEFQDRLKLNIKSIKSSNKAFTPADKTRNFYETDKALHDKLLTQNVTKTYRKSDDLTYQNINREAKLIAESLNIVEKLSA